MKKKITISAMILLVLFGMFIGLDFVNAAVYTPKAADVVNVPDENQVLYAYLDGEFDFCKIKFGEISGMNDMRRIVLFVNPQYDGDGNVIGYDDYFTVYCLDANFKYPQYSITNLGIIGDDDSDKLNTIMSFALFNHPNLKNVPSALANALKKGYNYADNVSFETDIADVSSTLNQILSGQTVTIDVKSVTYSDLLGSSTVNLTAAELSGDPNATVFPLEVNKTDLFLDKFTTKILSDQNYNHALWILEHSYPTLDLSTSLELAGANHIKAAAEVAMLEDSKLDVPKYGGKTLEDFYNGYTTVYQCSEKEKIAGWYGTTADEVTADFCSDKLNENLNDYVYATVQYAIWKVNNGIDFNEQTLGVSLTGSEELNKLYQYLITPRAIHSNYLNYQFDNTLELIKPQSNEIFKETNDAYIYGPYSVNYDVISMSDVKIGFNKPVEGASIIDEYGNEISDGILPNQKFYIKCNKNDKISNLSIILSTDNAYILENANKRGRIYYSYYPNSQNVISGGMISTIGINNTFELVFNPKTGGEDIVALFAISLILFSLVYIGISYKNKPVELN